MAKFILDGQEYCGGGGSNQIVKLTQAEYDALSNDKLSNDTIYLITDSGELAAENLFYDGSQTGLGNNIQSAIDKLNSNFETLGESVSSGKSLVANAITNKGVSTASSADFSTMATNIGKIKTNNNADLVLNIGLVGTNGNIGTNTPLTFNNNGYKYLRIVYKGAMNCKVVGDSKTLFSTGDGSWSNAEKKKICTITNIKKIVVSGSHTGYTDAGVTLTFSINRLS